MFKAVEIAQEHADRNEFHFETHLRSQTKSGCEV
jgi:hypothetical protein